MNLLRHRNGKYYFDFKIKFLVNLGDKIDYGQKKGDNIGDLI
jgi:hypothetical protein